MADTVGIGDSEPAPKKRKLSETMSSPTGASKSGSKTKSPSKSSPGRKRSREEMERQSSVDDKEKDVFSMYAIKKILNADETLDEFQMSSDAAHLIGKATEYFMNDLLIGSIGKSKGKLLEYDDISSYIDSEENLAFLSDIVPLRVPYHTVQGFKQKAEGSDIKESAAATAARDSSPATNDNMKEQ